LRREFNVTHRRILTGNQPRGVVAPPAAADPPSEFPRPRLIESAPQRPEWDPEAWEDSELGWGNRPAAPPVTPEAPRARPGRSLDELVARVALSRVSVVITGETGSGKDVLARRIHAVSPRAARPFVSVNCAAFCESLLDSELFGHQKGAFTGAEHSRAGLIEAADGGTLFLDELGELSPPAQAKLLRTIETRFVTRVGSTTPNLVDVRFVAATHRDLEIAVQTGRLRADLLYRLDGVRIHLPPLRERPADILPVAESFLDELARREGIARPTLTNEARRLLAAHDWPGNFRELRNVVERAAIVCDRAVIQAEDLLFSSGEDRRLSSLREPTTRPASLPPPSEAAPDGAAGAARPATRPRDARTAGSPTTEGDRIRSALSSCAGNQTRAAKLLGISRRTLITRLEQHGIPRPRAGRLRPVAAAKS
jgi:transcriptional regulator with PAS, ATPase and Fis domain